MIRFYKLICVLGMVMTGFGAGAQIFWSETFNYLSQGGFPPGWSTNGWRCDYDSYIFTVCGPRPEGNWTKMAGVSGYMVTGAAPGGSAELCGFRWLAQTDLLLQTPYFDLRSRTNPRLKFASYFLGTVKNGHRERATVEVTTDSGKTWAVLREPAKTRIGSFNQCLVDLSAYTTAPGAIRIGFRYTDSLEHMPGWLVEDLQLFEPQPTDLAMAGTGHDDTFRNFHVVPASVPLEGRVVNFGTSPVTAFTAYWQDGNGSIQSEAFSGINLRPLDTFRFVHSSALALATAGKHSLRMWVSLPGDLAPTNDTQRFSVSGCLFRPQKKLVIEDGTGNWNIGGPRGDVFLHQLDTAANKPIRISVHSGDVLEYKAYADHLYNLRQLFTQYFIFDRRGNVHPDAFFDHFDEEQDRFGFADLGMQLSYNAGVVSLDVDVHPAVDLPGAYRVAMILTEDNVRGTTSAYDQANGFTNNKIGPMGGYESKPDPVPASEMRYDYVARDASPGPEGRLGAIGINPKAGQHYKATFVATVGISYKKPDLNVVALLIRESDSTIVNAGTRKLVSLGTGQIAQLVPDARLQPNPARGATQLYLDLPRSGRVQVGVTDISGRIIANPVEQQLQPGEHRWTIPTAGLSAGMYLVRISGPGFQETLKLSVVE